ncbi:MAG: hypothetical protein GF329_04480 [Candidatus Lokiarchaeota archaeon]|nr:hypothetical protein [Candidatus Lokiarchaeota archaeon]
MSEIKKPPFLILILGMMAIIILAIIVLILHTSLYITTGWDFSTEYYALMNILILVGIVIPVIGLTGNILGILFNTKWKNESIKLPFLIGTISVVINAILIISGLFFGVYTIIRGIPNTEEFGFFLTEAILMFLAAGMAGFNIFSGIKLLKWKE